MVEVGGKAIRGADAEALRQVGVAHEQEGVGGAERSGDEDEPNGERERKQSDERSLRHASRVAVSDGCTMICAEFLE